MAMSKRIYFFYSLFLLGGFFSHAQQTNFHAYKQYSFPTELTSCASGGKIAWAIDSAGRRNVYVAESPEYIPRKLTDFKEDNGQEITSLSISNDGKWVVFVVGGEHGGNWETSAPINPSSNIQGGSVSIWSKEFNGSSIKLLGAGDYPVINPDSKTVAFIKSSQIYTTNIDGTGNDKQLFNTKGTVGSLEWSPNGQQLLFVANRQDHSIIGVYGNNQNALQWISPSFNKDQSPRWSPDGQSVVFIRTPGTGGSPDSMLVRKHNPWSIQKVDISSGKTTQLWKAPITLRGSYPTTHGTTNLHWAANDKIVFLSYEDGWPHLYSIAATGGKPVLLTPGNYMVEHVQMSTDKKWLTFSANTGPDAKDIERRHVARVEVDKSGIELLTPGIGLEWTPIFTGDGKSLAFFSATTQRPPIPALIDLTTKDRIPNLIGQSLINPALPQSQFVSPKQVIITASDGVKFHADLFEASGSGKKPTIVYVHGGPPRQMLLGWHYSDYYSNAYASNQYLVSKGFNVLVVNYRLGIGYGFDFHKPANAGASGASEYLDIKAAGEWLKTQPFVDPNKIGIYGGSYGGYLTALALARDSRLFSVGVDIHGVHDLTINLLSGGVNEKYEKAPDFDKAIKTAWLASPVSSIATWKSPILIIHADDDRNVRFNQSVDLIKRLDKKGVSMETLMIVDDTHHWMKHSNAVKVYQATADYFIKAFKN
jgi:Tol biopolymer transport system component/acetyl esterase/lipase